MTENNQRFADALAKWQRENDDFDAELTTGLLNDFAKALGTSTKFIQRLERAARSRNQPQVWKEIRNLSGAMSEVLETGEELRGAVGVLASLASAVQAAAVLRELEGGDEKREAS